MPGPAVRWLVAAVLLIGLPASGAGAQEQKKTEVKPTVILDTAGFRRVHHTLKPNG